MNSRRAGRPRKQAIAELRTTKEKIEQTRQEIERAERQSDLEKVARLRYGTLPRVGKETGR